MIEPTPPKLLLTIEEAAQQLSLGRSLLYEQLQRGTIPSVRIGRSRRIRRSDLEAFVAELAEDDQVNRAKFRKL